MDVTQLLEEDHRTVEALFDEYERTQDRQVLDRICTELVVHTTVEEELVYPRLEADPIPGDVARRIGPHRSPAAVRDALLATTDDGDDAALLIAQLGA